MITLNTDKGLVKIECWEDIISRPGFDNDLDPKESQLETIIGSYGFKEWIKCGLSTCHTPNSKGYLVVTKDGRETNIGQNCGKKYFGVDFETMSRKCNRDFAASSNRESLWALMFQLDEIETRIKALRAGKNGAYQVYKSTQSLIKTNGVSPSEVLKALNRAIKNKTPVIFGDRLATEQEVSDLETIERRELERPYYIEEIKAELSGLEVFYPENNLRKLLVLEIEQELKEFRELDIDSLSHVELKRWVKWKGVIDPNIEQAEKALQRGRRFLQIDNLKKLLLVGLDSKDRKSFGKYLDQISI